jgi:hypothetical protein
MGRRSAIVARPIAIGAYRHVSRPARANGGGTVPEGGNKSRLHALVMRIKRLPFDLAPLARRGHFLGVNWTAGQKSLRSR